MILCVLYFWFNLYMDIYLKLTNTMEDTSFFLILWNFSFCTYMFFIEKKTANNKLYMIGIKVRDIWS